MKIGMPGEGGLDPYVITDHLSVIRRAFGPKMSGPRILTQLARDLIVVGAFPIHIDRIGRWWLISSPKDWLLEPDGSESMQNFRRIVRFPEAGLAACHSEIL